INLGDNEDEDKENEEAKEKKEEEAEKAKEKKDKEAKEKENEEAKEKKDDEDEVNPMTEPARVPPKRPGIVHFSLKMKSSRIYVSAAKIVEHNLGSIPKFGLS
ncbi:16432_t:CDS:2, partial [Cetraspora pellucida]